MSRQKFNQYRAWAGDRKMWERIGDTYSEPEISMSQVCPKCQKRFEVINFVANCLCDECKEKEAK